jgi:hypothetical protein
MIRHSRLAVFLLQYQYDKGAFDALLYPPLRCCTPPHSHSIILSHRNALSFQRKFLVYGEEPSRRSVGKLRPSFQTEISPIPDSLGFSDYRYRSADFRRSWSLNALPIG